MKLIDLAESSSGSNFVDGPGVRAEAGANLGTVQHAGGGSDGAGGWEEFTEYEPIQRFNESLNEFEIDFNDPEWTSQRVINAIIGTFQYYPNQVDGIRYFLKQLKRNQLIAMFNNAFGMPMDRVMERSGVEKDPLA